MLQSQGLLSTKNSASERSQIKVLGLDPGSHFTGFGVIAKDSSQLGCWKHIEHGVFKLKGSRVERLAQLSIGLGPLIAEHAPDVIVLEKAFLGKSVESAFVLGQERGVCLAAIGHQMSHSNCQLQEHAPRKVKKGITGHGDASKEQVKMMVEAQLKISVQSLDASDALSLALFGANEWETQLSLNSRQNNRPNNSGLEGVSL